MSIQGPSLDGTRSNIPRQYQPPSSPPKRRMGHASAGANDHSSSRHHAGRRSPRLDEHHEGRVGDVVSVIRDARHARSAPEVVYQPIGSAKIGASVTVPPGSATGAPRRRRSYDGGA